MEATNATGATSATSANGYERRGSIRSAIYLAVAMLLAPHAIASCWAAVIHP